LLLSHEYVIVLTILAGQQISGAGDELGCLLFTQNMGRRGNRRCGRMSGAKAAHFAARDISTSLLCRCK
jgi:hypothetical protein